MRKSIIFILLILFSCQKDDLQIVEPYPQYEMIFEENESYVLDGQEFSFETTLIEEHTLIISFENNSVIAKEIFTPVLGLNTKTLYTKALPKEKFKLTLKNSVEEINTLIIVEWKKYYSYYYFLYLLKDTPSK